MSDLESGKISQKAVFLSQDVSRNSRSRQNYLHGSNRARVRPDTGKTINVGKWLLITVIVMSLLLYFLG